MLAIVSHPDCLKHDAGPHHPDSSGRLDAISNLVIASGLEFIVRHFDAPKATRDQLARVHDPAYIDTIFAVAPSEGYVAIDEDTVMSPGTLNAALHAAGAGAHAVDLLFRNEASNAFCPVRPPGHHAERAKAMGFCFFNNIAVAAAQALDIHQCKRVAIVDFDVHHGNGTQDIFGSEGRILFCSSFQHPFYPFSESTIRTDNYIPVPLSSGAGPDEFRKAVSSAWFAALDAFAPELILISAGFDAHALDDMSGLRLAEADYAWITAELIAIAARHSRGKIVSMLEGGYDLGSLARSAVAHMKALAG